MSDPLDVLALFILANLVVGTTRLVAGPRMVDRMLTVQLFGTLGVALLLVLAEVQQLPALRDIGLVFALLALLSVVAFTNRTPPGSP